ncbi:MAG TPA: carbon monoxide dehydrogenase subunit G [Pararobbsia sp.]|nr:carbon monoxide dehydrogenase subunit G [Pararobbsia sp.]
MNQSQVLPVSQQQAWDALNDPDVLRQCIPGCESIERAGDNEYALAMVAAIGPVKARFQGKLQIEDHVPPRSYKLAFNGQGGAAGFGKGTAEVTLTPLEAGNTQLDYAVHAQVGGKIAQIGSRLIDSAARKLAGEFFSAFDALLRNRYPAQATGEEADAALRAQAPAPSATADDDERSDAPGLAGVQDRTLEPTSRETAASPAVAAPPIAPRSPRRWTWTIVVIAAALVVWYITRTR